MNQPVLEAVDPSIPALDASHLRKSFRERDENTRQWRPVAAVSDISLVVPRREILGILGPNGSGKSTLIRLMATLLIPDEGQVRVFGHDVQQHRLQVRRLINRVSVEASFFKKLTAEENLAYATGLYGVPNRLAQVRAREILHRLGLPAKKLRVPLEQLSRGQQQKIAIARALLTSPTLMLLDEPTTGLDPKSRREVQQFIMEVRETHDATIIICTHDMAEAERLCDRVAIMHQGRFEALGTVAELKAQHGNTLEDVFFTLIGEPLEELNDIES